MYTVSGASVCCARGPNILGNAANSTNTFKVVVEYLPNVIRFSNSRITENPFLFGIYVKLRTTLIAKLLYSFCYKVEVTHGHIYYTRLKLTFNTVFCQCEVHL